MEIGITGGIGAGKSIVCRVFSILGIPIYDSDGRAKQLMEESSGLKANISRVFGDKSYDQSGKLNRTYLASLVFNDPEKVKELNGLVHPAVAKDYTKWVGTHKDKYPYLIKEAALLIESGSYQQLDYLVSVIAPVKLRIERVLARDPHRQRSQVENIISRQLSDEQRIEKSDRLLYNDEKQMLVPQILELHQWFTDQVG